MGLSGWSPAPVISPGGGTSVFPARSRSCRPFPGRRGWEDVESSGPLKPRELASVLAMPVEGMKCCRTQGKELKKQNLRRWENKDFRVQSLM